MISNLSSQTKCIYKSKLQGDCSVCVFSTHSCTVRRLIAENSLRLRRHLGVGAQGRNIAVIFKVKTTASPSHRNCVSLSPRSTYHSSCSPLVSLLFVCALAAQSSISMLSMRPMLPWAHHNPFRPPPPGFKIESPSCLLHCPCYWRGADEKTKSSKTK